MNACFVANRIGRTATLLVAVLLATACDRNEPAEATKAPATPAVAPTPPSAPAAAIAPTPSSPALPSQPASTGPAAALAPPQESLLARADSVVGTLLTIDPAGTATYTPAGAAAGSAGVALSLAKDAQIMRDGKAATLKDLLPGMEICFAPPTNGGQVAAIEAFALLPDGKPHLKEGPIDSVQPDQLLFSSGRRTLFPCVVAVTPATTITLDGSPSKLSDLRRRMFVSVTYINQEARNIVAATLVKDGKPHHVDGQLVSFSPDQVIVHVYGNAGFDVKLQPMANIPIMKETAPSSVSDLQTGQHVIATYTNGVASDITIKVAGAQPAPSPNGMP